MTDLTERLRKGRLVKASEPMNIGEYGIAWSGEVRELCHPDALEAATTLETLTQENARLEKDRGLAIKWANQSVSMLQSTFFPVADALRALEAYLANTPHHNAPEAAAARKVLRAFDACEIPPAPARKALGGGDE